MSTVSESTITSPELVLLEMILENDQLQSEADKAVRDKARAAQREAMQDELEALEDQAGAIRWGAIVQGGLTAGGGALTFTAALSSPSPATQQSVPKTETSTWELPALQVGGQVASGLAQPAGALIGEAEEADAQRDARAAAQTQEQATWVAEDAESHRQKTERHAEMALQQVQGILETQHQTTVAVLANV